MYGSNLGLCSGLNSTPSAETSFPSPNVTSARGPLAVLQVLRGSPKSNTCDWRMGKCVGERTNNQGFRRVWVRGNIHLLYSRKKDAVHVRPAPLFFIHRDLCVGQGVGVGEGMGVGVWVQCECGCAEAEALWDSVASPNRAGSIPRTDYTHRANKHKSDRLGI